MSQDIVSMSQDTVSMRRASCLKLEIKLMNLDVLRWKYRKVKKAGSRQESNPGHLWLEPPVLWHWATTARRPPTPTILCQNVSVYWKYDSGYWKYDSYISQESGYSQEVSTYSGWRRFRDCCCCSGWPWTLVGCVAIGEVEGNGRRGRVGEGDGLRGSGWGDGWTNLCAGGRGVCVSSWKETMRGVSLGMRKVLSYQLILETFYCINEYLSVETSVKVSNGKLFLISSVCMTNSTVFFSGPLGGEISPPKQ